VLLAGSGAASIYQYIPNQSLSIPISTMLLLPGVIAIYQLHPYQYIYYNRLVGGIEGAAGRYHLDYWCTSMRQSASFLNEHAPPDSDIAVTSSKTTIETFLRDDLHLYRDEPAQSQPDFGVHCNKSDPLKHKYLGLEPVYRVEIRGVVLNIVEEK
jgi:hypothetical protein